MEKTRIEEKKGFHFTQRKSILWSAVFAATMAGLYFFNSGGKQTPISPPATVISVPSSTPQATKPAVLSSKTSEDEVKAPVFKTAPSPKTAGIALNMAKRHPITPQADFMAPRWSPDGLDILATKAKYNGLYLISSDGTNIRRISDAPGIGYDAHWSPDGRYIVVEQADGIRYYDRSGEEVNADDVLPSEKISSVYARDDAIYLRSEDDPSGDDQVIMDDEDKYFAPVASPDGNKVAYIGLESGIVIKDLQTREEVFIGEGTSVSWMPDGRGIIFNFTQDDGKRLIEGDIYFASTDGSIVENLTNTPDIIERHPRITGDGSQLAFESDGRIFTVEVIIR